MKPKFIKYNLDWWLVALTLTNVVVILIPFTVSLTTSYVYIWAFISLILRLYCPLHHHNHGHLKTFRSKTFNNVYDFILSFVTGFTTAAWELHHNIGHHASLMKPEQDVISLNRFNCTNGSFFNRIKFTLLAEFISNVDCYRLARRHHKIPQLAFQVSCQILIYGILIYLKPFEALCIVILPAQICRWAVFFVAYHHHRNADYSSVYTACNDLPTQFLLLNLGYHTAHHEKPTRHWSLLSEHTRQIIKPLRPIVSTRRL